MVESMLGWFFALDQGARMRDRTEASGEQVFPRERARSTEPPGRPTSRAPAPCEKDGAKKEFLSVIGATP
jgi:hypothetical protein